MKALQINELEKYHGGEMEIVIIFHEIDAFCGIQRIYADGDLYSMRLVCD